MTRLLVNPGPTNTAESVKQALVVDDMSHRSPAFRAVLAETRRLLTRLLGADEAYGAVLFASSGTGANEGAVGCVDGPVLAVTTGRYSERLAQIAERGELPVRRLAFRPFEGVDVDAVARALDERPAPRSLLFVHHETTTGLLTPLAPLCRLARARGVTTVVDAISSAGAHPLGLDGDGPDWVTVTANKCLEGIPGVAFVLGRRELLDACRPGRSFYFDVARQWGAQRDGQVPFTVPVQVVFALREALRRLERETPAGRVARYAAMADHLRTGLTDRGFQLVELPAGQRSDVVVPVRLPAGLDFPRVQAELEADGIEIYSAGESLRAGYFFLAAMGALEVAQVDRVLAALLGACRRQGCQPGADGQLAGTVRR